MNNTNGSGSNLEEGVREGEEAGGIGEPVGVGGEARGGREEVKEAGSGAGGDGSGQGGGGEASDREILMSDEWEGFGPARTPEQVAEFQRRLAAERAAGHEEDDWREEDQEEMLSWAAIGVRAVQMELIDANGVALIGRHRGCEPFPPEVIGYDKKAMDRALAKSYGTFSRPVPVGELSEDFWKRQFEILLGTLDSWLDKFMAVQVEIMGRLEDKTEEGLQKIEVRVPDLKEGEVAALTAAIGEMNEQLRVVGTLASGSADRGAGGRGWRKLAMPFVVGLVGGICVGAAAAGFV